VPPTEGDKDETEPTERQEKLADVPEAEEADNGSTETTTDAESPSAREPPTSQPIKLEDIQWPTVEEADNPVHHDEPETK
jgi:hypothetical protein